MADPKISTAHRFHAAAQHYLAGRPDYARRLIQLVRKVTDLKAAARVLDLGCGPGSLAAAFAPYAGEVVAIDPEPEMLRIAVETFGGITNLRFIAGSSDDLSVAPGPFSLVTMGRSFHWMDRPETLRRLDGMIERSGAVALFDSTHCDVPDNAWHTQYRALLRHYSDEDKTHARRHSGIWMRHEAILLDSPFNQLEAVSAIERRQVAIPRLVDRAFSMSSTAPDRLGAAAPRLAGEICALLSPLAPDGWLTEVVETAALIARRPG